MDIILAFVWGMITVVYTLMALVVVQMRKSVKELESQIRDTDHTISDIYKTIDEKERELINCIDELNRNTEGNKGEVYRYIDSRFDKFENKVINKKEILKG